MIKSLYSEHYGKALLLFISVYSVYINVLLISFEDKGVLLSTFSAIWAAILLFLLTTGNVALFIRRRIEYTHKILLVLFLLYMIANSLFYVDHYSLYYSIYISVIIPFFILGIIYQSKIYKPLPVGIFVRQLANLISKSRGLYLVVFISLFVLSLSLWHVYNSNADTLILMTTINNEYYQNLGDFYLLFFIGWLGYRHSFLNKASEMSGKKVNVSLIILVLETAFSVLFLQIYGSNKASLTVTLIAIFYIYYLNRVEYCRIISLFTKTALIIITLFITSNILNVDISNNLRLFSELDEAPLWQNTSITSRTEQFKNDSVQQLEQGWIFGDMSIAGEYMHSSVLSIQTHLGIIGTFMFWSYVILSLYSVYFRKKDILLKSIAIPILFVSIISSVFWWPPLWFLIGALYVTDSIN